MPVWENETETARRHVTQGESEIKQQLGVIAELERSGQSTVMAKELLAILERSLRGKQDYLERLLKG
jgi:hypothetical protein